MLEDIARILRLINEKPNKRSQPRPDDLQGFYTSWFDGGAVNEATGYTRYKFADGSEAMEHVPGYFYITITLADGTNITVIEKTPEAGKEFSLIGQKLLEAKEMQAKTLEMLKIEDNNLLFSNPD